MIPNATLTAMIIATACFTLVPAAAVVILLAKRKLSGIPFVVGVAAFFVSQILLRIPLLNYLSGQSWFASFASSQLLLYLAALSLSAGLFEESARLGGAYLLKKKRTLKDAISFGLGHGLCEVVALVGITYINNVLFSLLINSSGAIPDSLLPTDIIEGAKAQLTAVNPPDVYLAIVERVSSVAFHIFASVLVFKGVVEKKLRYYFIAILAHGLFNLSMVLISSYVGIIAAEAVGLVLAAGGVWYVYKSGRVMAFNKSPGG